MITDREYPEIDYNPIDGTQDAEEIGPAYVDFIWKMKQNDLAVCRILSELEEG